MTTLTISTSMTTAPNIPPAMQTLLDAVAASARRAGVFAGVVVQPGTVVCDAKASAAPAQYRITFEGGPQGGKVYAEVTTADRWLSHSIEADLLNTGDKLEELIDEELVELGAAPLHAKVEHFRNDAKLFVFRSALPMSPSHAEEHASAMLAARALLAYEACFSKLGDMSVGGTQE